MQWGDVRMRVAMSRVSLALGQMLTLTLISRIVFNR